MPSFFKAPIHSVSKPATKQVGFAILLCGATLIPQANAGLLDSIQDIRNTVSTIGETARTIEYSKQNVDSLGKEVGINRANQPQQEFGIAAGSVLVGKLKQTKLYAKANNASSVVSILNPEDIMIYMGTESKGFMHVQSDKGEGWVAKPLVSVQ